MPFSYFTNLLIMLENSTGGALYLPTLLAKGYFVNVAYASGDCLAFTKMTDCLTCGWEHVFYMLFVIKVATFSPVSFLSISMTSTSKICNGEISSQ